MAEAARRAHPAGRGETVASDGRWAPGTPVFVRNSFTAGWAGGFVVESAAPRGRGQYRLRRLSDNAVLPASFAAEDLRPA